MLTYPFYLGDREEPVDGRTLLPRFNDVRDASPESYVPEAGLRDAVNVALLLNQPLLLTGEPGTGKTRLAYHIAWELGFGTPLKFETKSTSEARDLFYTYDALGRFHKGGGDSTALDFINFQALGRAILRSRSPDFARRFLPPDEVHDMATRSVVLIDEVDKAPRDFPNDVLNELEGMYFRIHELENVRVDAGQEHPPIVVITSNSEKHLPDPFLRRCVYYHIAFPDRERLSLIVNARVGAAVRGDSAFLDQVLDLFLELRKAPTIRKKPATAELLGWVLALRRMAGDDANPFEALPRAALHSSSGTLAKTDEDRRAALLILDRWMDERDQPAGNGRG